MVNLAEPQGTAGLGLVSTSSCSPFVNSLLLHVFWSAHDAGDDNLAWGSVSYRVPRKRSCRDFRLVVSRLFLLVMGLGPLSGRAKVPYA